MRIFCLEFYSSWNTVYSLKMKSWKVWQLLALIFPAYLYGFTIGVELELCSPAIKNEPCNMTCHVQNFSQPVNINCNGTSRGSCSNIFCPPNMIKEGGNAIHLEIASLSYASDNCNWTCTFGIVFSSAKWLEVKSGILEPINIMSQNNANGGVKLTATADCLYPASPIVMVQYSEQHTGPYASLAQQVDLQSSTNLGGCSDAIERRVTAMSDVSAKHEELAGKSIFFRMRFSQYPSGPFAYTNITGPFSFEDCKLEIRLFGSLPVSLCVPITSIVIIILLILKKEPFFKRFGELTKKKVLIIILFILVAIIIGLCLGLLIEGICDNKYLALGLSFLFAILLAVALILILLYYHKKFESKKDIQDGGAQDGNGSSQNNTGSNTTRTTTERVGSPASTSNVELAANLKSEY